jgi:hypothetical protein
LKTAGEKLSDNFDQAVTLLRNRIDTLAQVMGDLDHSGSTFEAPTVCGVLGMLDAAVVALHQARNEDRGTVKMQATLAQIEKRVVDMENFVLGTSSPLAHQALKESTRMVRTELVPYEQAIRKLGEAHQAILARVVDVENISNPPAAPLFGQMFGA